MMRISRYASITLLLLLTIGVGVAFIAPALLVRPVLAYYLTAAGFELTEFTGLTVSLERAVIERLAVSNSTVQLMASTIGLDYSLSGLAEGSLRAIDIAQLELELLPANADTAVAATAADDTVPLSDQISAILQTLDNLPLANLRIEAIDVRSADTSLDVVLAVDTQPLRVAGTVASDAYEGMLLQIAIGASNDNSTVNGEVSVLQNLQADGQATSRTVMQTTFTATFMADTLQLQTAATVNLADLQSALGTAALLTHFASATEVVSLTLDLAIAGRPSAPALTAFNAALDSPERTLLISQFSDLQRSDLQLQLPIQLTGSMPALDAALQIVASPLATSFNYADAAVQVQGELDLGEFALGCTLALECSGTAALSAQIPRLQTAGVTASNLTLASAVAFATSSTGFTLTVPEFAVNNGSEHLLHGESASALQFSANTTAVSLSCDFAFACDGAGSIEFIASDFSTAAIAARDASLRGEFMLKYADTGLDLSMPAAILDLPALVFGDASMSTTLELTDLFTQVGTSPSARVSIATQHLSLGLADVELRNPSITGNISYADGALNAELKLALANQLQAVVAGDFALLTQTGNVTWDLPAYFFSNITPLSALISQSLYKADVVGGSISGNGQLAIARGPEGEWLLDGPLMLDLNELSGFVEDSFFVGLDTEINTTISGAAAIRSQGLLSGRVATLDVGLPLTDIRWNYRFDSEAQTVGVSDFTLDTLGGQITMADFDYAVQNPDTTLTVVLTNLNLQSIVDLAKFPDLRVEGLISGYLPLTLTGNTLTVNEGLIGALHPGGTIRYGSGSTISSGNATLDLVNEALANYHYQIMNTRVYYNEAGDLRLEVQLLGNNPDLYSGQLVNLNVNIDDNIPTLLRSLQASRTITDALQQRLLNRQQDGIRQGN